MDLKNKVHRLNALKEMETVPKPKGKEKARKELWDSLLAVYENEADIENGEVEMEEVDVGELEEWTITNPDTSMRALTQLAATNPQILTAAGLPVTDDADLILESDFEEKEANEQQVNIRTVHKGNSKILINCKCKSPSYMKAKKTFSPVKKCKKPISILQKEKLSTSLMKKKIKEKKSRYLKKRQETPLKEDSELCVGKRGRKPKLIHSESKESVQAKKVDKHVTKHKKVQLGTEKEKDQSHKCKLEYRYYLNTKNVCARPDNRVFNCKLIFKLCHCSESDVVL